MAKGIVDITNTGFVWNNVTVDRVCDGTFGTVVAIKTEKHVMYIRVTPGGKIRIEPKRGRRKSGL